MFMMRFFVPIIACSFIFSFNWVHCGYVVRDLGLFEYDQSVGSSINDEGAVVGQYCIGETVVDFLWKDGEPLHILTTDAVLGAYPKINNQGHVAGVAWHRGESWWEIDYDSLYHYDDEEGFRFIQRPLWKDRVWVAAFSDDGKISVVNSDDPKKISAWMIWKNNHFYQDYVGPCIAFNHEGSLLCSINGLFKEDQWYVFLYDWEKRKIKRIAKNSCYYGVDLNNNGEVVFADSHGNKGYLWSEEKGLICLGFILPQAINDRGEIIGTNYFDNIFPPRFLVRKADGTIFNIEDELIPLGGYQKLTDVRAINNKGQILARGLVGGKEHLLLLDPEEIDE